MSDKKSKDYEMSELVWASERLRADVAPAGSVKGRIRDAARRLGWPYSRTKSIWYADERVRLHPHELRTLEEITGLRYGRQEIRDIDAMLARADALLEGPHEDFYRPFVAALRAFVGNLDRS